jgi:hypothetical protein
MALNSLVAVENRFNIVPMTLLIVAAVYGVIQITLLQSARRVAYAIGVLAGSALLT